MPANKNGPNEKQRTGPLYPNQPLIEVGCEIKFTGEPVIEARRHEFYEEIRKLYPLLYVPNATAGISPALQHYRFEREDRAAGAMLAINSFCYFEKDYSGAQSFQKELVRLFNIASNLFKFRKYTRVGWRYINAIPFTRENGIVPVGRFFKDFPQLPAALGNKYEYMELRAEIPMGNINLVIHFASATHTQKGDDVFMVDIDTSIKEAKAERLTRTSIPETVDKLHNVARAFFEDSITDNYREYLKGAAYE